MNIKAQFAIYAVLAIAAGSLNSACAGSVTAQEPTVPDAHAEKASESPNVTRDPVSAIDAEKAVKASQAIIVRAEDDAHFAAKPNATLDSLTESFDPDAYERVDEVRPSRDAKGCTSVEEFYDYYAARSANNTVYEYQAAEDNGWKRVSNLRIANQRQGLAAPTRTPSQPKGTQWLAVYELNTCGDLPDVYIDGDHDVFVVYPENDGCSRTRELKVCGRWAIRGRCGRDPGRTTIYALVPEDAKAIGIRGVKLPERKCYSPRPTGGVSRPG